MLIPSLLRVYTSRALLPFPHQVHEPACLCESPALLLMNTSHRGQSFLSIASRFSRQIRDFKQREYPLNLSSSLPSNYAASFLLIALLASMPRHRSHCHMPPDAQLGAPCKDRAFISVNSSQLIFPNLLSFSSFHLRSESGMVFRNRPVTV